MPVVRRSLYFTKYKTVSANLWKQCHRGQGPILRVKEGLFQCGTDGQQCQGELHPYSLRERNQSQETNVLAGDTPTGGGEPVLPPSHASEPSIMELKGCVFPIESGKGLSDGSLQRRTGSRSEGQDPLATCGSGRGGISPGYWLTEPEYKKGRND